MEDRLERLEQLARLFEKGALTQSEFAAEKANVLKSEFAKLDDCSKLNDLVAGRMETDVSSGAAATANSDTVGSATSRIRDRIRSATSSDTTIEAPKAHDPWDDTQGWRHWAKWAFGAVAGVGIFVALAKFGTSIAIFLMLAGIGMHVFARLKCDPSVKQFAYMAYAAATLVFLLGWLAGALLPRPTVSKLTSEQFSSTCGSWDDYEENCIGKFVIFEGRLSETSFRDDGYIVEMGQEKFSIEADRLPEGEFFKGMKVKFSGYLTDRRDLIYYGVADGKIMEILNNRDQARQERVAAGEIPSDQWCSAERGKVHTKQGIKAACRRMTTDGVWGQGLRESACVAEEQSNLRECGIKIYDGNAPNAPAF